MPLSIRNGLSEGPAAGLLGLLRGSRDGLSLLPELRRARATAAIHQPAPPPDGLVLEVGAGQSPHLRADVIVDKFVVDDFERPAEAGLDLSRPLVVADAERLPFADGTFAYSIALHVLEHVEHPTVFASELARVSAAGFVQVPTRRAEQVFGWPYHRWVSDLIDGELVLEPKPPGYDDDFFHRAFSGSPAFVLWFNAHREIWHHSVRWESSLKVKASGHAAPANSADVDVERTMAALAEAGRLGRTTPLPQQLAARLRCPDCMGSIRHDAGETLQCVDCGLRYPTPGGVPCLLREFAT